jgi:hypothetical protein
VSRGEYLGTVEAPVGLDGEPRKRLVVSEQD